MILFLVSGLSVTVTSQTITTSDINSKSEVEVTNFTNLKNTIDGNGSTPLQLVVRQHISLENQFVVPRNVSLRFEGHGRLQVARGAIIHLLGELAAPLHQIFFGEGLVRFSTANERSTRITTIYPQWFGAQGDAVADVSDDTDALQRTIDAAPDFSRIVLTPGSRYKISRSLLFNNRGGLRFGGLGGGGDGAFVSTPDYPDAGTNAPAILWAGVSGGVMMQINSSRYCEFENFTMEARGLAAKCMELFQTIDGYNSDNTFRRVRFNAGTLKGEPDSRRDFIAVDILNPRDVNCEFQKFIDCAFFGNFGFLDAHRARGIGLRIRGFNTKSIEVESCTFGYLEHGIDLQRGSFVARHNAFTANKIDYVVIGAVEPIVIEFGNSEHARQGAVLQGWDVPIVMRGNRFGGLVTNAAKSAVPYVEVRPPFRHLIFEANVYNGGGKGIGLRAVAIKNERGETVAPQGELTGHANINTDEGLGDGTNYVLDIASFPFVEFSTRDTTYIKNKRRVNLSDANDQ